MPAPSTMTSVLLLFIVMREESNELALREVLHQRIDAEGPRLAIMAGAHAVDELAELRCGDGDDVVALVGEPLPRRVAILHRREHSAEEQRKAVRILMVLADGLRHEVGRIAADLADRGMTIEDKAIRSPDVEPDLHAAHIVKREAGVKQPQERANGAGGVVVLGLRQQQRRTSLEIAQIDV